MSIRPSKRPSEVTKVRVRELRANPSEAEKLLWSVLRAKSVAGIKFRRQHPIEPYIADFYCAKARLVIEVDGESHDARVDYDRDRTAYLTTLGL
jgi:ATP-dependent DNA helicase RecQ